MTDAVTPRPRALAELIKLAIGAADPVTSAWLRAGILRWARSDGAQSLSACLHLGDSPRRLRLALRDEWLKDAARFVGGSTSALAREIEHYRRFKQAAWQRDDNPPIGARAVEVCVHHAALAAPLPRSWRQLHRIVSDIDRQDGVRPAVLESVPTEPPTEE